MRLRLVLDGDVLVNRCRAEGPRSLVAAGYLKEDTGYYCLCSDLRDVVQLGTVR